MNGDPKGPAMTQPVTAPASASSLEDQLRARLREDRVDLPVLPASAQDVLRMTADPGTNARQLAAKIAGDPALSAHVLRVANSALYAGGFTLTSIRQAVGRLGLELIGQIATTVAVQSSALDNQRYQEVLLAQWRHALHRGLCAREIARQRRDCIEHAFLGGLLCDLGQACIFRELDRMPDTELEVDAACRLAKQLGDCAGAALARKWELAPELAKLMSTSLAEQSNDTVQLTVALADAMAAQLDQDAQDFMDQLRAHSAAKALALPSSSFEELAKARQRIVDSAHAMS